MTKTLDDLKRGTEKHFYYKQRKILDGKMTVSCSPEISEIIDYLHAQGRIVPDGYVAVDAAKIPIKKPYIIFHHDTIGKTVTLDERTYLALNKCAVLLDKAMIAAAQKGDE